MKLDASLLTSLFGGPVQHDRLLRLHTPLGANALLAETLDGVEAVVPATGHAGFRFELTALSASTHVELKQLIGQPVLLELLTGASRTQLRPWHGHVTQFSLLGSDGGLARYRLIIEPWFALLAHRTGSRSFQGQTVLEVLEAVFARYQSHGRLSAAWRFDLADAGVYPQRSLVTQYQESDLAFVQRLLAEEGLFAWFEHQGDAASDNLGAHTLVIADHNGAVKPGAQARVRFAQSGASFKEDTLTRWGASAQLGTAAIELQSWDYRQNALRPVRADAAGTTATNLPPLVRRDLPGVYAYETREQGERIARRQQQTLGAAARLCEARGGLRAAAPATSFELAEHASANGGYTVMAVRHRARNNIAADAQASIAKLLSLAQRDKDAPLYECDLVALPIDLPVRALALDAMGQPHVHELTTLLPRPAVHGAQTAVVVSAGEPIHTDRDHRVKVQFHWQRGGQSSHRLSDDAGYDNAPANDQAGTWVRVATALAGANWGSVFTPRAGQEVVVEFLDGDIDRPVVVGSVYNGQGQANAQGNQAAGGQVGSSGNAPAWFPGDAKSGVMQGHQHNAVQVGFKTQEYSASASGTGGANQLVFDASPGEARVLLATSTAATRLQLGHLLHQRDNQRLQPQGHGAELHTAALGALRGGSGSLLSTYGRPASSGQAQQMDARETQAQLDESRELHRTLADSAQKHQAKLQGEAPPDKLPTAEAMKATQESLAATEGDDAAAQPSTDTDAPRIDGGRGSIAAWSRPDLVLAGAGGIGAYTPASTVASAGQTLTFVAGQDASLNAQRNHAVAVKDGIALFTYGKAQDAQRTVQDVGMKLHAASGKVSAQAQSARAQLNADKAVTIASTSAGITVTAPNSILLAGGGSYLKIEGGNIELGTSGAASFKAAMKELAGAGSASAPTLRFGVPTTFPKHYLRFVAKDSGGMPLANKPYVMLMPDGTTRSGTTDAQGRTEQVVTDGPESVNIYVEDADHEGFYVSQQ